MVYNAGQNLYEFLGNYVLIPVKWRIRFQKRKYQYLLLKSGQNLKLNSGLGLERTKGTDFSAQFIPFFNWLKLILLKSDQIRIEQK